MEFREDSVPTKYNRCTWVYHQIDPASLGAEFDNAALADLRDSLSQSRVGKRLIPPGRLHMTEAQFKGAKRLTKVVRGYNPSVCDSQFADGYQRLYSELEALKLNGISVEGRRLEAFGRRRGRDTLVLEVIKSSELRQYREPIVEQIIHFLTFLGVEHPHRLMEQIRWLRDILQPEYTPHISLAWDIRPQDVPRFDVYGLHVVLQPPRIYHPR